MILVKRLNSILVKFFFAGGYNSNFFKESMYCLSVCTLCFGFVKWRNHYSSDSDWCRIRMYITDIIISRVECFYTEFAFL